MTDTKHPMQPVVWDKHGIARFKGNAIVQYLLDHGSIDLNALARLPFDQDDRQHFAQLIGYSVSGFGDLSYAPDDVVGIADAIVVQHAKRTQAEQTPAPSQQATDLSDHVFPSLSEDAKVEVAVTPSGVVRMTEDRTKVHPDWPFPYQDPDMIWDFVDRIRAEERERERERIAALVSSVGEIRREVYETGEGADIDDERLSAWLRAGARGNNP